MFDLQFFGQAGKLDLNLEPVNLVWLIDEVIGTAGQLAEKNRTASSSKRKRTWSR